MFRSPAQKFLIAPLVTAEAPNLRSGHRTNFGMKGKRVSFEHGLAVIAFDLIFVTVSVFQAGNEFDKYAGIETPHPIF